MSNRTKEEIRAVIREESFTMPCPVRPPPPADVGAEKAIVSTLLCGHAVPSELVPLCADDFTQPMERLCFAAAVEAEAVGAKINVGAIAEALAVQDVRGPVPRLLLELRDEVPVALGANLRKQAESIVEHARTRRALERIRAAAAMLEVGRPLPEALAELEGLSAS